MTDREKAIVMAHTGVCMLTGNKFQIFHRYVEEIMGRPVMTHEMGWLADAIKEKARPDFIALCAEQEPCEELDFVQPHKKMSVNLEVCKMREATQEEREGVDRYIDSIAEPCEDAITRILKRMWNCRGKHTTSIDKVKMEQIIRDELPSVNPQEPCEDAISRQAVLDLAKFDGRDGLGSIIHAFDVEQLPPVTPVKKQEPCKDAISRQAAIYVINHAQVNFSVESEIDFTKHKREVHEIIENVLGAQEKALKELPPVTAEKVGQINADVLGKIRSEIDSYCSDNRDRNDGLYIAMRIIDKYKTESEE